MSDSQELHQQEASLSAAMRNAQQGDAASYKVLLEGARVILQVYASRTLRRMGIHDQGSVDDLVQETLLAVHAKRHTYDPSLLFTPWLFAIARYKLIDFGRGRRRAGIAVGLEQVEDVLEAPVFTDPTTEVDLKALMEKLPKKTRQILELVKLEGLSIAETAARTQMSESAIKVTVHRALKALRMHLSKKVEE